MIKVSEYEITLDFAKTMNSPTFTSTTVIRFTCREPGAQTWVDLIASEVHRVNLNGVDLDPEKVRGPERLVLDGLAIENTVVVEATHLASTGSEVGRGISRSVDVSDGEVYVWSQFEAFDARRAFPCFDQPDLKAAFSSAIRAPLHWRCVSNGKVEDTAADVDARVWRFARTPRLPTYVTAFCAGPFHVVEDTSDTPAIRLHARRSLAAHLESAAPELIELTRDGLAHFGRHFGMSYAGDSYDYAFLPDFGGAMENFGCVAWTDEAIYRSGPAPGERRLREIILLHEMAHMWFGNLVTMRWWDGLWLNESFADWAAFWALSHLKDQAEAWSYFLLMRKYRGYIADQSSTTHPISTPIADIEAAEASVDMITYAKGASVLRQLVAVVGEDRFLAALRRYFGRFAWQNTDVQDLVTELEREAGRDLSQWAGEWLGTAGPSTLKLEAEVDDGVYRRVRLCQTASPVGSGNVGHRLDVGVYDDGPGGVLRPRRTERLEAAGAPVDLAALWGTPAARLLLPNDGDLTFAKVRVDEGSLAALRSPRALPTTLARSVAVHTLYDMMMDAELPSSAVVDAIVGCVATEPESATLWQMIMLAEEAAGIWTPPASREAEMAKVAQACLNGLHRESDPARRRVLADGLILTATTEGQMERIFALFADPTTSQPMRWGCLRRLVAADMVTDRALEIEALRDPDPSARYLGDITRAARCAPAAKEEGLALMLGERPLSAMQRRRLASALWQPLQVDLLTEYAERYADGLRAGGGASDVRLYALAVEFPLVVATDELITKTTVMTGDDGFPLRVRNRLRDKIDLLARARRTFSIYTPE